MLMVKSLLMIILEVITYGMKMVLLLCLMYLQDFGNDGIAGDYFIDEGGNDTYEVGEPTLSFGGHLDYGLDESITHLMKMKVMEYGSQVMHGLIIIMVL